MSDVLGVILFFFVVPIGTALAFMLYETREIRRAGREAVRRGY